MKTRIKDMVLGPALDDIRKLIDESRPPVLMLIGRRGHGKSSLINALADKDVATVNDFKPQEPQSEPYLITFAEEYSTWKVIDTRGIFESSKPDGSIEDDSITVLKQNILKYKPDVILHVINTPEISAAQNDMTFRVELKTFIKDNLHYDIPLAMILNKADTFSNPRQWPPEEFAVKAVNLMNRWTMLSTRCLKLKRNHSMQIHHNMAMN